jgi:putative FmdB family regulatory protein
MPVYEYECLQCGKRLEVMQKFSDKPLTKCPDCNGKLKKLISNTSFVLKGSGWYVTDYASPERKNAIESEKGTKQKKSSETKADSKAGEKADSKKESAVTK